eukprot:XP_011605806.1 PREDICTED: caldesmon-like [Takifugu rubripes]
MDDDFDRRMELRRQRREQMRLDAQTIGVANDDDEEEAREQRRRAREERKKMREVELAGTTEVIDTNSVSEADSAPAAAGDDDQVLLTASPRGKSAGRRE